MRSYFSLQDLVPKIGGFSLKLEPEFFRILLCDAARSERPWREKAFVEKTGYMYNSSVGGSSGLSLAFRQNRALKVATLAKILSRSQYSWNDVERHFCWMRAGRHDGTFKPSFPLELNDDLGLIAGHILGDGSIDGRYSQVFFTNSDVALIREFSAAMRRVFGVEPRVWIQRPDYENGSKWICRITLAKVPKHAQIGLFYPTGCGLLLRELLGDFAVGKMKTITPEIIASPSEFQRTLVRAFFDDEGSVDLFRSLRFHNDNKQLLIHVQQVLQSFGIVSCPIRTYEHQGKTRCFFNVCSYRNFVIYEREIGVTSPAKKRKLSELLSHIKSGRKFNAISRRMAAEIA